MSNKLSFQNCEDAYELIKKELTSLGYIVKLSEKIQNGIQFVISFNNIKDLIRVYYSKKKGVNIDLSQARNSRIKKDINSILGLSNQKNIEIISSEYNKSNIYTLCIGINNFIDENLASLSYAADDAQELHNLFAEKFGVGEGTLKLLNEEATMRKITEYISKLAEIAKPEDTVLFFIASHGEFINSSKGPDYYLIASDSEYNNLIGTAIPMSTLKDMIAKIKTQRRIVFLDTCYSGGMSRRDNLRITEKMKESIFQNFQSEDIAIITSSQANQVSHECDELKHGVFSYYLLSGLTGAVETKGGEIDLPTLYAYIHDSVRDYANKKFRRNQNPKFFASYTGSLSLPLLKEPLTSKRKKLSDYKKPLDNISNKFKFETINCIGIDESGKGDYFGPLVVAGVYVDTEMKISQLRALGVRDSKKIPDNKIRLIAERIKKICGKDSYEVIFIPPPRYNQLYRDMGNLNEILAWAHAKSLEVLLKRNPECNIAISDQFAGKDILINKLKEKGRKIELIQRHKAEENIAVAAASVLARAKFIELMEFMEKEYNHNFHKGENDIVIKDAVDFVKKGKDLIQIAKIHFKTTEKVMNIVKKV